MFSLTKLLGGTVAILFIIASGMFVFYNKKLERLNQQLGTLKTQCVSYKQELQTCYTSCNEQLNTLQLQLEKSCELQKQDLLRALQTCKKQLERKDKLQDKLNEIDNL